MKPACGTSARNCYWKNTESHVDLMLLHRLPPRPIIAPTMAQRPLFADDCSVKHSIKLAMLCHRLPLAHYCLTVACLMDDVVQTRNIDSMLVSCWASVCDVGPTFDHHRVNVLLYAGWDCDTDVPSKHETFGRCWSSVADGGPTSNRHPLSVTPVFSVWTHPQPLVVRRVTVTCQRWFLYQGVIRWSPGDEPKKMGHGTRGMCDPSAPTMTLSPPDALETCTQCLYISAHRPVIVGAFNSSGDNNVK